MGALDGKMVDVMTGKAGGDSGRADSDDDTDKDETGEESEAAVMTKSQNGAIDEMFDAAKSNDRDGFRVAMRSLLEMMKD